MKYYIMVKKRNTARWLGAIPVKQGTTKLKIISSLKKSIKNGFNYKIINELQLKNYIKAKLKSKLKTKTSSVRRPKRRKIRRSKIKRR